MALKVFYLDDEADLCELFQESFESEKVSVTTFCDPEQFVQEVQVNAPHLVLLDYRLPHTNGEEVGRRIDPNIPKALITGDLLVEVPPNFLKVFSKPFNFNEMESFIEEFQASLNTSP